MPLREYDSKILLKEKRYEEAFVSASGGSDAL